jgi:hypothetical protein
VTKVKRYLHVALLTGPLLVVLSAVLGLHVAASVQSWDWTISGMSPQGNMSYHASDSVSFASSHWIQLRRVATGSTDYATVWGKNGYQESGGSAVLIGSQTDAVSWSGSGDYYWSPDSDLTPSGNHVFGGTPRSVGVWWKSTWSNSGGGEQLVTKNTTGQSAYYSDPRCQDIESGYLR